MPRPVAEVRIQERAARARLQPRNKPYWRALSEGAHLGYRRGVLKGSWIARAYRADARDYVTRALGEADDLRDADGHDILNYKQAFEQTLRWIDLLTHGVPQPPAPDLTVADAAHAYIARRNARRASQAGRAVHSDAASSLTRYVLRDGRLPTIRLADLTESDLRAWQLRIRRRTPASTQRVINDLKAALNAAFELHRRVLPTDLPITIKFGLKIDAGEALVAAARDNQILTDDQVRSVVAAAFQIDDDFGRLVTLLAATGARFSQVARLTVGDVQPEQSRLMLPQSYKGKRRSLSFIRMPLGADTLAALAPVLGDRPRSAALLEHWRHRQIGAMRWEREERSAWASSSAMLRPWQRAVAAAGLPASTIPYALRHSAIVRGLRKGLPIRLVAALHDTSVAMIERHYARWITEGLDELAARAVVPLVATHTP